jgi:hypothetical protein
VCALGEHISIESNSAAKCTDFGAVCGRSKIYNALDFLVPQFGSIRGEPETKKISFLYGPLAFARVDGKAVLVKALEDLGDKLEVVFPVLACNLDVVDVNDNITGINEISKNFFHGRLSPVR